MAKRKLRAVNQVSGRAVLILIGGQAATGTSPDGDKLRCGSCGELLASRLTRGQLLNVVLVCPLCGANNDVPDEPAGRCKEVHLLPGTYYLGKDVKLEPGVRLRGVQSGRDEAPRPSAEEGDR